MTTIASILLVILGLWLFFGTAILLLKILGVVLVIAAAIWLVRVLTSGRTNRTDL
jgi:hypothetical protein